MGFVIIKESGVRHLPRWSVGHAGQARRWVRGVQGAEHSASFTEPCRQWGSPFASPIPGDEQYFTPVLPFQAKLGHAFDSPLKHASKSQRPAGL